MVETITEADKHQDTWYEESKRITLETLPEFLRKITEDYGHDYGTICHAVAAGALAAARAVDHSPAGGITGFQAGAVMWEFIAEWQGWKGKPLRLVEYSNMLYPQYESAFGKTISEDTWQYLQDKAAENLSKNPANQEVKEHWEHIVQGIVPFGYVVKENE